MNILDLESPRAKGVYEKNNSHWHEQIECWPSVLGFV